MKTKLKAAALAALILVLLSAVLLLSAENRRLRRQDNELEQALSRQLSLGESQAPHGVAANGFLSVKDGRLVNQRGEAIQLRGLSSHGLAWYPQYANTRAMLDLKARGANLFRAAMYADSIHEGYNENAVTKRLNKSMMYLAIENALAADLYVIVDWHILKDQNPLLTVEEAVKFFDEISARYPAEAALIYEICNEPNGDTTWLDIHEYASRVIPVIRKNAPRAVVLVGTPDFSSNILSVMQARLSFENVMYTFHLYIGSGGEYKEALELMGRQGLGVFVSEWGINVQSHNVSKVMAEARDFIDFMKRNKISWANWSLSNKDEDFSAIRPEVTKLSSWTETDLTESGRIIFDALSGD